jgi:tetratricopeptide (TPR) repeat protein
VGAIHLRIAEWFQTLSPKQQKSIPYLLLTGAVLAAYANVYHNAFVWDDMTLVVNNASLRQWKSLPDLLDKTTVGPYYRPVQALLYFFIYQIFGLSQAAFHGANVLLQAGNTCLMYRLGCRLGFYRRASFVAALLWGIHPLWIEAVAVVAGTSDLLAGLFCMTGLLVLLPDFTRRKTGLAVALFLLALGSKESAVVFPALVTFTLFLVSRQRLQCATYLRTGPLWLLAAAYITGWLMCPALNNFESFVDQNAVYVDLYKHSFVNRLLTSLATLPVYLSLMITPAPLHMAWWDFPIYTTVWNWQVMAGAAIVAAALMQIVWQCERLRRNKNSGKAGMVGLPLSWGLLWFAAALSPDTGILKPVDGFLFEHWIYLPAIGLFLGVSQTAAVWMDKIRIKKYSRKASMIASVLVVFATLVLGTKTYLQNKILYDRGSMFENILKYYPGSVWAHDNLATFYFEQKAYEKAAEQWRQMEALDYMRYITKSHALYIHNALAFIYLNIISDKSESGLSLPEIIHALPSSTHIPEAIKELEAVRELDPNNARVDELLAEIYYYLGEKDKGDYYKAEAEKISVSK